MRNEVELAQDGVTLRIRFGYRPDLVSLVKELPDRRFDGASKTWSVPARHAEAVYKKLAIHMFDFSSDVMSIVAGTMGKPKEAPRAKPAPIEDESDSPIEPREQAADTLTISALNERIRECVKGNFMQSMWITGEVLDFDKGANKQHKYFALVEKGDGASKQKARIDAVIWDRKAAEIFRRMSETAPDFAMRDGIEIRALVKVDYYVPTGKVSVHVEEIDPSFTLGKLALNREQILRALREQGLAELNKSLLLPIPPLRIGVLTSESADGWNDFKRHLEGSGVGFQITLLPIAVQGDKTRANVLGGLAWFAARANDFDCVCILRGGGSRTDLAWFDDMDIALAVAKHPIKVLIGIGHERDRSVLDEIAHSEKTPTAVAAFLADTVLGERRKVADRAIALQRSVGRLLQSETNWLSRSAVSLGSHASSRIRSERQQLDTAARDLRSHSLRAVAEGRRTLETAARTLQTFALQSCERKQHELARASDRARHGAMTMLQRAQHKLEQLADKQRLLDPRFVLRRGFALVRDEQGRVVPSAARIEQGQQITIQMRDGSVRTRAEAIENKP